MEKRRSGYIAGDSSLPLAKESGEQGREATPVRVCPETRRKTWEVTFIATTVGGIGIRAFAINKESGGRQPREWEQLIMTGERGRTG